MAPRALGRSRGRSALGAAAALAALILLLFSGASAQADPAAESASATTADAAAQQAAAEAAAVDQAQEEQGLEAAAAMAATVGGGLQTLQPPAATTGANTTGSTANATVTQLTCVSYAANTTAGTNPALALSRDGGEAGSSVLVGEVLGSSVGPVEVRDLALDHPRVGLLRVTLHWLPFNASLPELDAPPPPADAANPPTSLARAVEEAAVATVVLKRARQGGNGANLASASFTDAARDPLPTTADQGNDLAGIWEPATPLYSFAAAKVSSKGRWVLVVEDVGGRPSNRTLVLRGWSLVLCPPANGTLPANLAEQMAQQAFLTTQGGAISASSGAGLFGASGLGSLLPAGGTLTTVSSTTEYLTYSDLADQAVDAYVAGVDNAQALLGLPYQPTPILTQVLPWVELLTGLTDLTLQNTVWPGKIVAYALQLELFVRQREAAAAKASNSSSGSGTGSGSGGSGSGSGNNNNDGETPNCGVVDGPRGKVVVNKKLLQREVCAALMPPQYAQYTRPGAMGSSGFSGSGSTRDASGDGTVGQGPDADADASDGADSESDDENEVVGRALSDDSEAATWLDAPGLRLRTPLRPLDFTPRIAPREATDAVLRRGPLAGAGVGAGGVREQLSPLNAVGGGAAAAGLGAPRLGEPFPAPNAATRIVTNAFNAFTTDSYNEAMDKELEARIADVDRMGLLLDAAASSPAVLRAGPAGKDSAKALKEGTNMVKEVLKAGQDAIKRMRDKHLRNKTQEWLKNGGIKKEMDGMNKASGSGSLSNRFIFNFQRIRLSFRFSPQDGFQFTFIQWLYNLADVNNIISTVQALEKLDMAANGQYNQTGKGAKGGKFESRLDKQQKEQDKRDKAAKGLLEPLNTRSPSPSVSTRSANPASDAGNDTDADVDAGPGRRLLGAKLLPTGETVDQWMARTIGDANALAKKALSNIPLPDTIGKHRRMSA
ncbi:hypothetical protein HYH03_007461 [Edaphochlamys debaryana]|uniref:Uncharacterized protein n=1 Tax=Edaphochlamys debaryana TaxID=47281 RepID=A0A836C0F3_9CHLO|nr:hypothetical protein HYH03_007461 [Edaphochlamys debaryana]|eukprot:KAG2494409.1 hypothetical protein HYH03_007461 [Edaphochlamys debaryana]